MVNFNRDFLPLITAGNVSGLLHLMMDIGLLAASLVCQHHEDPLEMNLEERRGIADGYQWRCTACRGTKSVRTGSFFAKSKKSLATWMRYLYRWTRRDTLARLSQVCSLSMPVAGDYANLCRGICTRAWQRALATEEVFLGGRGVCVAVVNLRLKCCRRTRCSLFILIEADKPVVLLHIKANTGVGVLPVKEGTHVYTNIRALRIINGVESFSLSNFPQLANIEDVQQEVLIWFREMRGITHRRLDSYVEEFNWRQSISGENLFDSVISAIKLNYML